MNTIRLDVCIDLADTPRVRDSVINHGLPDMDTLWRENRTPMDLAQAIREALIRNEPRLRAETLEVRVEDLDPGPDQRVTFEILAEMISDPTDIAVQFHAEVDGTMLDRWFVEGAEELPKPLDAIREETARNLGTCHVGDALLHQSHTRT